MSVCIARPHRSACSHCTCSALRWHTTLPGTTQGTRDELHQRLSSQIHHHLEQCGWPPPLAAAPRGQPGAADGPLSMADGEHAFDAAALFGAAHAQDVSALQRLLVALTDVQRLQEGPELEQVGKGAMRRGLVWVRAAGCGCWAHAAACWSLSKPAAEQACKHGPL